MSNNHQKVKLNVRVSPSTKQDWKDALDDDQTLSELVRRSVEKELHNEFIHVHAVDNLSQDIDLSEITERLSELQATVESLQRQIDMESISDTQDPSGDAIADLAMDAVEHVPTIGDLPREAYRTVSEADDTIASYEDAIEDLYHTDIDAAPEGTVTDIAEKLREDDDELVWHALVYLERKTTESVHSVHAAGQRHWVQL